MTKEVFTVRIEVDLRYVGDIEGYPVYYYPELKTPMGVGEYDGETAFIFGDYLQLFPDEVVKIMIQHELGHIRLNHIGQKGLYLEFEADMYAARRYGVESVIVALAFTLLLTTKRESKDALRKRIRYMKKRRQPEGCFLLP
jgi:hypothetical protein